MLWIAGLEAQSITSGSVSGRVCSAQDGRPFTHATLTLRNPETGWVRTARTDPAGRFRFQLVPVGTYALASIAPGALGRRLQGITVRLGGSRDLVIRMEEATASAVVDVVGASSEVDVLHTGPVSRFLPETLGALPQAARDLTNLLILTPGATPTGSGQVSVDGARATQNQLLVDGMSVTSAYSGWPLGMLSSSFLLSLGTVQEVQVLSHAFDAQLGEAAGAVINALTRSGTNQFRGQCLIQERPASGAARMRPVDSDPNGIHNRPENLERRFASHTLNLVLSGPLVQDRAHFLIGLERYASRDFHLPAIPVRNLEGWRAEDLEAWKKALGDRLVVGPGGRTWSQDVSAPYATSTRNDVAFLRLDVRLSPSHALALRVTTAEWSQPQGGGSLYNGASQTLQSSDTSQSAVVELQSLVGPDTIHELRLQRATERFRMDAASSAFPEIAVATLYSGQSAYAPERYSESLLQLSDVWNLSKGRWTWKAGVDLKAVDCRDDSLPFQGGSFRFPSYRAAQNWAAGTPSPHDEIGFSQSFRIGDDTDRIRTTIRSAFLQGQRQDAGLPGLAVQVGLRGTWQTWDRPVRPNPLLAGTDTPQGSRSLDPRISFLWRKGAWTLRGGLGRFSSPNLGVLGLGVRTWNGLVSGLFEVGAPASDPLFTAGALSPAARLEGSRLRALEPRQMQELLKTRGSQTLNLWDPDDRMAQCWKSALELVWEPDGRTLLKMRATTSRTRNLAHWININLAQCDETGKPILGAIFQDGYPTPVDRFSHRMEDRPGRAVLRGRDVQFDRAGDVYLSTRSGRASNTSLVLELSRKADQGLSGFGSVTLSRARDINTNEHNLSIGPRAVLSHPADPDADEAPSDYDQPFRLVGMLQYATNGGLRVSLTGRMASGRPFTALDYVDLNGDGLYNDASRDLGGRNGQRFPGIRTLDLLCAQRFSLGARVKAECSLEVYNMLNDAFPRRTNVFATYQGQTIPGFAVPNVPDRNTRNLRLGLQLTW